MKLKFIFSSLLILFVSFIISSCDDSVNSLGTSIQPDADGISVGMDTLALSAKTMQFDSIFGKTKNPVLGEYQDPFYGTIRSDYLGELYIPEGSKFPESAVMDSVQVGIFYKSWEGDSIAPMEVSVYELTKMLPTAAYYTNFNPKEYYTSSSLLGKAVFTASNLEVAEKERKKAGYYPHVIINLSEELGERFLAESKKENSRLQDSYTLRKFFHGLYLTTSFGNGTIIQTDYTLLNFHFHYLDKNGSSTKKDTIRNGLIQLSFSPEVTQINHIENKNAQLLGENSQKTFLKSPGGVYSEVKFPFSQLKDELNTRALNLASFSVNAIPDESGMKFKLTPPPFLLLLNKDSLPNFFSKRKMFDNVTSFYAKFNPSTHTYNFGDISTMVNYYKNLEQNKGVLPDLTYVLVPVNVGFTLVPRNYQQTDTIPASVSNLLMPHAAALRKEPEYLNLKLIFSDF